MNAMSASPSKPIGAGNHDKTQIATAPKIVVAAATPSNSQINHNSIPHVENKSTVRQESQIPPPANPENPLDLNKNLPKHTSNGIPPLPVQLEHINSISPSNSLPVPSLVKIVNVSHDSEANPTANLSLEISVKQPELTKLEPAAPTEKVEYAKLENAKVDPPKLIAITPLTAINAVKISKVATTPINAEFIKPKVEEPISSIKKIVEQPSKEKECVKKIEPDVETSSKEKECTNKNEADIEPVSKGKDCNKKNEPDINANKQTEKEEPILQAGPSNQEEPKISPKRKREPSKPVPEEEEEELFDEEFKDERKSKRVRLPTQVYQSPLPELQLIEKLNTPPKVVKQTNDKLVVFFKNEFLAVRNVEGTFFICQTFQNIQRGGHRIRIRWFNQLPNNVFEGDFADRVEFDCILTNVKMTRVGKNKWKLSDAERTRVENILKRTLDVEQGVVERPSVTEEHPDGLDLSLFKGEAQLKKSKKKSPPKKREPPRKNPKRMLTPAASSASTSRTQSPVAIAAKKGPESSYLNPSTSKNSSAPKGSVQSKKKIPDTTKPPVKKSISSTTTTNKVATGSLSDSSKVNPSTSTAKLVYAVKETSKPAATSGGAGKRVINKKKKKAAATGSTKAKIPEKVDTSSGKSFSKKKNKLTPLTKSATVISTSEKPSKVRSAGNAVAAKINSAAARMGKSYKDDKPAATNRKK